MRSRLTAVAVLLLGSAALPAAPPKDFTLLVVDSPGQPADRLAIEAWRQTRHRSSGADFRWIRLGSPEGLPGTKEELDAGVPGGDPVVPDTGPPPVEPEWDPTGTLTVGYRLTGLPRLLLLDRAGEVQFREVFMDTAGLRYLVRHPDAYLERVASRSAALELE